MEIIRSAEDIGNLSQNQIIGSPAVIDSSITFEGSGNLIFCEPGVTLQKSAFTFYGDNNLVYLSSGKYAYYINARIHHDSTVFIGRDNFFDPDGDPLSMLVCEGANVFLGGYSTFETGIRIRTTMAHAVYQIGVYERMNEPMSVLIGDHVWLEPDIYISRGTMVGTNVIMQTGARLMNVEVPSNSLCKGLNAKVDIENVFYTDPFTYGFSAEETKTALETDQAVYFCKFSPDDTVQIDELNALLAEESGPAARLEMVKERLVPETAARFYRGKISTKDASKKKSMFGKK